MNYHRLAQSWVCALSLPIVYSNTHLRGGRFSDLPNHIAVLFIKYVTWTGLIRLLCPNDPFTLT
jgi:hypothetical protein